MLSAKQQEVDALYQKSDGLSTEIGAKQRLEDEMRLALSEVESQKSVLDTAQASSKMALEANLKNVRDRTSELYNHEGRVSELEKSRLDALESIDAIEQAADRLLQELADIHRQAEELKKQGE
jgi:chromosome segregation ATPase